ncbi:hypothetical protein GEMRC1_005132 [Eukaryota sp. GEM-RC1]
MRLFLLFLVTLSAVLGDHFYTQYAGEFTSRIGRMVLTSQRLSPFAVFNPRPDNIMRPETPYRFGVEARNDFQMVLHYKVTDFPLCPQGCDVALVTDMHKDTNGSISFSAQGFSGVHVSCLLTLPSFGYGLVDTVFGDRPSFLTPKHVDLPRDGPWNADMKVSIDLSIHNLANKTLKLEGVECDGVSHCESFFPDSIKANTKFSKQAKVDKSAFHYVAIYSHGDEQISFYGLYDKMFTAGSEIDAPRDHRHVAAVSLSKQFVNREFELVVDYLLN